MGQDAPHEQSTKKKPNSTWSEYPSARESIIVKAIADKSSPVSEDDETKKERA